jgi:hypothetical protein
MSSVVADRLPGFRRRFRITPEAGSVQAEVEDDFHRMSVTVHHDGGVATSVDPVLTRAPWTTCPGAVEQLKQSFTGAALDRFAVNGDKSENCTHLFDLAQLAAAHAYDAAPTVYDIFVTDPVDGKRHAELVRNGAVQLRWIESGFRLMDPPELAGMSLDKMRPWIESLDTAQQEAARLLRWGTMLANGRTIPMEKQSDASRMPSNCYTFQPLRKMDAKRIGKIRDFSDGKTQPLDELEAVS